MDFKFSLKRDKNILIIESCDEIFYQRATNIVDNLYKKHKDIIHQITCNGSTTTIEIFIQNYVDNKEYTNFLDLIDEIFIADEEKQTFFKQLKYI